MKLILPDGVHELAGRDVLLCRCTDPACDRVVVALFLVFDSNIGAMICMHCGQPVEKRWGRLEIAFVPEPPGKQLSTLDMLAPADLLAPTTPEPPAMRQIEEEDGS